MPSLLGLIHQAEQLSMEVELFDEEKQNDLSDELQKKLETYMVLVTTVIPSKIDLLNEAMFELSLEAKKLEKWSAFIKSQLHEYFSREGVSESIDYGYGERFVYPETHIKMRVVPENIPVNRRLYSMSIGNLNDKEYSEMESYIKGKNKPYSLDITNSVKDVSDIPDAINKKITKTIKILKNRRKL